MGSLLRSNREDAVELDLRAGEPVLRPGERFSDVLSNPSKNSFNILRLFCALAVIYAHSFGLSLHTGNQMDPVRHMAGFVHSGSLAVAVFFLVSGVFVTQSFCHEKNGVGFILKRVFRIWPALAVCLFITAFAAEVVSKGVSAFSLFGDGSVFRYILRNAALNLTPTIDGVFVDQKYAVINGPLWTLPLEVMMYAVVFLLGVCGILRRKIYLLAVLALGVGLLVASPAMFTGFLNVLSPNNAEIIRPLIFFLVGIGIFSAQDEMTLTPVYLPILFFLAAWAFPPVREFFGDLFIITAALWVGGSALLARLPKLPGDYSYGLYIYGWPIQQLIVIFWPEIGPYGLFVTAGSLALLCAVASWHFVEKPAQKVGKRLAALAGDPAAWRAPLRGLSALGGALWVNGRGWLAPVSVIALAGCGLTWADYRTDHLPTAHLPVRIVAFGPTSVVQGRPFNVQPRGGSALWVATDKPVDPADVLVLGGHKLRPSISSTGKLLSVGVPPSLTAAPGTLPLLVEFDSATHREQSPPVPFVVKMSQDQIDRLPTGPLPVRIVAFGPTPVVHGQPFNAQPSGWSAIWVATDKPVDPAVVLVLGGRKLQTSISSSGKLLSAGVPPSLTAASGALPLLLEFDSDTHRVQSPAVSFVVN